MSRRGCLRSQDINTPLTTPSGNLHGCPVSFLMGLPGTSKEEIPEFAWIEPVLKSNRLVYIGLRDIDEGERKILKDNSATFSVPSWVTLSPDADGFRVGLVRLTDIKCFTMHHVDKYGIGKVVEMALEHVGQDRPIHLSFDVGASAFSPDPFFLSFSARKRASSRANMTRVGRPCRRARPDCCAEYRNCRELGLSSRLCWRPCYSPTRSFLTIRFEAVSRSVRVTTSVKVSRALGSCLLPAALPRESDPPGV